jgi:hypothetical protein
VATTQTGGWPDLALLEGRFLGMFRLQVQFRAWQPGIYRILPYISNFPFACSDQRMMMSCPALVAQAETGSYLIIWLSTESYYADGTVSKVSEQFIHIWGLRTIPTSDNSSYLISLFSRLNWLHALYPKLPKLVGCKVTNPRARPGVFTRATDSVERERD